MKLRHYITFDRGAGPVTFIEMQNNDRLAMLRITHNAVFDRVKEVDPVTTREAINGATDLGNATTKVIYERADVITRETLNWAVQNGCDSVALRWGEDGEAIHFRKEEDAIAWDGGDQDLATPAPKRRRVFG